MKHILITTAGHVDHGKTTLVKILTGIDTDRLPEEKKRGLSIDMGFAYIEMPDIDTTVELIDIPGHERFIKNSIAGIASAQALILTVDAVEGIKHQTKQHLQVAKAFGINKVLGVITKIDRSTNERTAEVEREIHEFLIREGFEPEISLFSSKVEETKNKVLEAVKRLAISIEPMDSSLPLRILIDSAFSVRGFGTVLRGSMIGGRLGVGERIVVEPIGKEVRVRKMQSHGKFVEEAVAGQRIALNIPELDHREVERGFWVLRQGEYKRSRAVIIESEAPIKSGPYHSVFFGMREIRGRFRRVEEGVWVFASDQSFVAFRNDRVPILSSEGTLIGGGRVLHPSPLILNKKFIKQRINLLKNSLEEYLKEEKPVKTTPRHQEDSPAPEEVKRLLRITSERIREERELIEEGISKDCIRWCVKQRKVHRLGTSLLVSDPLLRTYTEKLYRDGKPFSLQEAKEILNLSRKYIIPLLEYLDYMGLTVREGNIRRWKGRG